MFGLYFPFILQLCVYERYFNALMRKQSSNLETVNSSVGSSEPS